MGLYSYLFYITHLHPRAGVIAFIICNAFSDIFCILEAYWYHTSELPCVALRLFFQILNFITLELCIIAMLLLFILLLISMKL